MKNEHFHDDASRTGKVFVGYSGPFLTNTRTWFPSSHGTRRQCPPRAPRAY